MLNSMSGKLIGYSGLGGFGAPGLLALPQGTTGHVATASSMTPANPRLVNAPTFTLPVVPQTSRPPGTAAFTVPAGVLQAALAAQAAQANQAPAPQPAGTGWDGLSTGAKVGIVGGGFLLLLGVAYLATKTSKSTTQMLTPNRSRRRRRRTKRSTKSDKAKFYVGDDNVKVRFPQGRRGQVQAILDKYPPPASLTTVSEALKHVGASFTPWEDGSPGDNGLY